MLRTLATILTLGLAVASPSLEARGDDPHKLIIGAPFQVLTADFDGTKFTITGNVTTVGSAPSWLLYKQPNLVYAVNENANDTSLFQLRENHSNLTLLSSITNGALGVVHLEFNFFQTIMVGAGYGSGMIYVWNSALPDGTLELVKQVNITGKLGPKQPNQAAHHPHQAAIDPLGRFFLIPNLGGDAIEILDTHNGLSTLTRRPLFAGSGPRHGGFLQDQRNKVTYYAVVCELSNEVKFFKVKYLPSGIKLLHVSTQSTYGPGFGPANKTTAAAGEIVIARNMRDVYISNRLSGNETDSISHFIFNPPEGTDRNLNATLTFDELVSSGGIAPRMFSLSADGEERIVFVANQGGENGLLAMRRDLETGNIDPKPIATVLNTDLVAPQLATQANMGPYFIQEIV
ncbi:Uu.00g006120.m01.CDS01 [Anthostomella pinea]|uniref:Uu.00g006120.m01.CDS01 n=1 Tax=Anthostomella pinea TaxID=933095 RepID=A0AAI8YIZ4_9PEZI|nr:Uu.00g006120.m01.CDS01 [Anthostomella pinea]